MKRHHRPLYKPLLTVMICLLLAGCWDAEEIENRVSVIATAVDREGDELLLSIQVPIPKNIAGSGGNGGGGKPVEVFTGRGKTVADAMDSLQYQSNKRIFFGNNRLLLFSEEVAKRGLGPILDAFRRNPEFRRRENVIISREKAMDLLKIKPDLEQVPTEFILSMLENGFREGLYSRQGLNDLYVDIANPGKQPVMNVLGLNEKKALTWFGVAVFQRDRLVGVYNRSESRPILHIRKEERGEVIDAPCGSSPGTVSFKPKEMSRKVQIKKEGGLPVFHIALELKGGIVEKECTVSLEEQKTLKGLEEAIAQKYKQEAVQAIRKAQHQYNSDIFHLGNRIRGYNPVWWNQLDWQKDFSRAKIKVAYKVVILRTGMEVD